MEFLQGLHCTCDSLCLRPLAFLVKLARNQAILFLDTMNGIALEWSLVSRNKNDLCYALYPCNSTEFILIFSCGVFNVYIIYKQR